MLEFAGGRLLTDPTFDEAGAEYRLPAYTLRKTQGPAVGAGALGRIDAVLLSHDHHFDNLDRAGRELVARAEHLFTTTAGAQRLGGAAQGLEPWQTSQLTLGSGSALVITATPARHGPAHADRGPVVGFVLRRPDEPATVYVSGDTVWFDGVREVAERFDVRVAVLFLGAARVHAVGDWPLTFTSEEAVIVARAMPRATIVPVHFEGWEHFSESRQEIERAFANAGIEHRLRWLTPGAAVSLPGA